MKKFLSSLVAVLCLPLFSLPAYALTFEVGDNVDINEVVNDDVYLVGSNITVTKDIAGDLYMTGAQVIIEGNVSEDLVVGGGKVVIHGNVQGDLRVIGGQVSVFGNVGDDLLVAGGQVDVGKNAVINGSVAAGAGLLTVDGTVRENIRGGIGALFLHGTVNGDVVVTIQDSLKVGEAARIGGDLEYSALLESNIPDGVVIGETLFNQFEEEDLLSELTTIFLTQRALSFIGALFLLIILIAAAPKVLTKSGQLAKENVIKTFVVGLLSMIGLFISFFLLMVTLVGIPIAMIVGATMVVMMYLAKLFACAWIGSYFLNYKRKIKKMSLFKVLSLVLLAYYVIGLIPFVGWLVNIVLFLIGVGAVLLLEIDYCKFLRSKKVL